MRPVVAAGTPHRILKAMGDSTSCDTRRAQVDDLAGWINNVAPPDLLFIDAGNFGRLFDVGGAGHEAAVVSHGNNTISDHQPPFVWLGLE